MPAIAPVERVGLFFGVCDGFQPGDSVGVKPVVTVCVGVTDAVGERDALGFGGGGLGHQFGFWIHSSLFPKQKSFGA